MDFQNKKLLVVTQHFWPENFRINDIVDGFLADGIAVDVLCGLPNYPKGIWFDGYSAKGPFFEEYHGARIYRCKEVPRTGNSSVRIFLNYVSWPLYAALALHRLPGGYDAVLCYNTSPVLMSWPAILAAKKFKAPLTNYVLDIWPENLYSVLNIGNKFLRWVAQTVSDWHYKKADRLIAMSPGLKAKLLERVGETNTGLCKKQNKQYAVIPQYCEDFYAAPACHEGVKAQYAGRFNLMFAGNFSPAQSLDTALKAMARIRDGWDETSPLPRPHLLLVGDGMSRKELEALTDELSLRDWVRFYGSVKPTEIPALSGAADVLLVPLSDSPDLGLTIPAKLASCMAASKPLLVSINGEGAAAAAESGGALVSPACDDEALAENLLRLAAMTDDERSTMGKASFAYYQSHYRRAELLRQIEEFIF
ncbi:MAG: glycosyltransferase family 4 protein [Faecalibacterium sp.]|nr:glycosyltransferase family 4 protein [Faecalibacterium sp.]